MLLNSQIDGTAVRCGADRPAQSWTVLFAGLHWCLLANDRPQRDDRFSRVL